MGRKSTQTPVSVRCRIVTTKEQVSSRLGEEVAILNLRNGVYYGLDAVGAKVWELIRQPRRVCDIRDALLEEFEVEPDGCERDLLGLLQRMATEELIEVTDEAHE